MDQRLFNGLDYLSRHMPLDADPWWIIGSAALVISGIEGVTPDDIDVVSTPRTLRGLLKNAAVAKTQPRPHERFRSDPFGRIVQDGSLDIEVQGNLEVCAEGQWRRLEISTREAIQIGNARVFVPSLAEQKAIFILFGRPKDMEKAAIIDAYQTLP